MIFTPKNASYFLALVKAKTHVRIRLFGGKQVTIVRILNEHTPAFPQSPEKSLQ
jgi:hypothetical protein